MSVSTLPNGRLGSLDAESAADLIAAAADVALVLDGDGVIRDVALGSEDMLLEGCRKWIGQPWAETVTVESRAKVETLLREATSKAERRWRQVNHPSSRGSDVPVLYSAVRVGQNGQVVAFGRDLRPNAQLQQRLVDAQQSMERDYWRLRHVETRYRLLFMSSLEAVLIIDAATQKIVEANPAAGELLGENARKVVGRSFPEGFDTESTSTIGLLLARARAVGRGDDTRVRLSSDAREFLIAASLFSQENGSFFLVRLAPVRGDSGEAAVPRSIVKVMESLPDGFVVTDLEGQVITANRAFVDLAQTVSEAQLRGESLERWLGRSGVDFSVLIGSIRQHGSVRLFSTVLRGEHGATSDVEVSAVSVPHGEPPCLGFTIRDVGRRAASSVSARVAQELPRSANQLTELVGRVSLKELVRESTDLIEKLCIEAALELTRDNRASAAEMLGLSRQSLYVKLRRYGLGDLGPDEPEPAT
ncbi:transcriptional regulator PpsR [uncultured Nevskia sp.]|uniref:transcriptional regulator PpsR n=1 Tax=uncultured Nevskia sp. TaxID=228950 RepID=UPI0025D0314C|nr:transcriptional regulator PpsR [uncultured Nevskia sp.]